MSESSKHDAWQAGEAYDVYMGRWSRQIAPLFLQRIGAAEGLDWVDVGCGTGALTQAILSQAAPTSVVGVDASDGFVARARQAVNDARASFVVGDAQALPIEAASRDMAASALVLNFVPDRVKALAEMRRVARRGGWVGFFVWDYPGGGLEFLRAFWDAAAALDPAAADLAEDRRFPFCEPGALIELAETAGLGDVRCEAIEVPTVFRDFDDYWRPFTLGAGPAPGYCASLLPEARDRLRDRLDRDLPRSDDGTIALRARAWSVLGPAG